MVRSDVRVDGQAVAVAVDGGEVYRVVSPCPPSVLPVAARFSGADTGAVAGGFVVAGLGARVTC